MEKVEKIPSHTPEWDAECQHFQELVSRWRNASNDRQLQEQMGLSLRKLGFDLPHHDRET
jgi:hypothetical protein